MDNILLEESGTTKKSPPKKYKCPYCDQRFERSKLHIHIQNKHADLIPEGYTALRVAFNTINNKTEGHCIICKGVTDWNEDKGRYERLCNNPECKEKYKQMVAERNKRKYDTERLQTDPRYAEYVQKKALEGRKISGKYKFADGGILGYVGTYERKFLEFCDKVMHCKSEDFLEPGPAISYMFQEKQHIYLPDYYYIPYNLIVEIKDGGNNKNNHPKRTGEDEEKLLAKEAAVAKLKKYNYVRVTNNDFGQFMSVMAMLKFQMNSQGDNIDFIIKINEAALLESESKSKVDKNFVPKEHIRLSSFKRIEITEELINKYKKKYPVLRHVRCKDTNEYICDGYMWMNGDDELVCYVGSCEYTDDHTKWIVSLEIVPKYKSHGLSKQILDFATKTMKCKYLSVSKDNKLAISIYKAYGFRVYYEDKNMYYMSIDPNASYNEFALIEDMSGTIGAALPPGGTNINIDPNPIPYESDPDNYYLIQHPNDDHLSYSITKDPIQYKMLSVDPQSKGFYKVYKSDKGKLDRNFVTFKIKDKQSAKELYNELAKVAESTGKIYDSSFKSPDYIYEALTNGAIILDPEQVACDDRFELVDSPAQKDRKSIGKLYQWLKGGALDKLEEQVEQLNNMPTDEEIDYNVLPDGNMTLDQLNLWHDKYSAMPLDQRIIADDISTKKYGMGCMPRYDAKLATTLHNIPPEVNIHESSEEIVYSEDQMMKAKNAECDHSIILMVLTDTNYNYTAYTDEDIEALKEKWNRYTMLPEDQRQLSTQTALTIFGIDNEALFDRAINYHMSRKASEEQSAESEHPVDEGLIPYFVPSMEVLNSNPGKIFTESGYIDTYNYIKAVQELQCDFKRTKSEAIREQIIDYGWNPEIPCSEMAIRKAQYKNIPPLIEEVNVTNFLEAKKSNNLTLEQLKEKIVPIFVVLLRGEKLHSKAIEWFTDSEWSHACLALDSSLNELYSFNNGTEITKNGKEVHVNGFIVETREKYMKETPNIKVKVFALFITPEQKKKVEETIKWYLNNRDKTAYSFKAILNIFMRRATKYKDKDKQKMVCSQFVYTILKLVDFKLRKDKDSSTISPGDIDTMYDDARFFALYSGKYIEYKQSKANKMCDDIIRKLPLSIYGITEAAIRIKKSIAKKFNRILEMVDNMLNK